MSSDNDENGISFLKSFFDPPPAEQCVLVRSEDYKRYQQTVALKKMEFMTPSGQRRTWMYTDYRSESHELGMEDDKEGEEEGKPEEKKEEEGPLVMLGGVCCTTETFFRQFRGLCPRGHRLVAVQPTGDYLNVDDWIDAFCGFLDKLDANRIHLFGSQLGGYLAMRFVAARPSRVFSLILCNAFCDTEPFITKSPFFSMFASKIIPDMIIKHWALSQLPDSMLSPAVADAIDFVVHEIEITPGAELLTKAKLILEPGMVKPLAPDHPLLTRGGGKCVTVIMSEDANGSSFELHEEVLKFFPDARVTVVRDGGDFPYLSSAEEVNMFIEVHLRFAESIARNGEVVLDDDESEDAEDSAIEAAAAIPEPKSAWE